MYKSILFMGELKSLCSISIIVLVIFKGKILAIIDWHISILVLNDVTFIKLVWKIIGLIALKKNQKFTLYFFYK